MNNLKHRSLVYVIAGLLILSFAGTVLALAPAWIRIKPKTATITVKCFAVDRRTPVACEVTLLDASENKIASKNTTLIFGAQTVSFTAPTGKSYCLVATPNVLSYIKTTKRLPLLTRSITIYLTLQKK